MGELMTGQFTLEISSDGKTLSSETEHDHSRMHILLNTPMCLDHRKTWYANMSSIEVSKHIDTVICAPDVKKELSIRVGRMEQCPYQVDPNNQQTKSVTWIGETTVSFDFTHDLHTPSPSFINANTLVQFIEYNEKYNRVKLLNHEHMTSRHENNRDKRFIIDFALPFYKYPYGVKKIIINPSFVTIPINEQTEYHPPAPPQVIEPTLKIQDDVRKIEKIVIENLQPWSHIKKELEIVDLPDHYFTLTDVLEFKVTDGKLDFKVIADNPYGVNYAVMRAPTELSYMFGFPYEFSTSELSSIDPWYFAPGSKRWRIKACGIHGNTKPWDIWHEKNLKIYHFSEICIPLYELNNVKVITDFTEVPLTESKQVINTIPLGAWMSNPATKYYHMCIQSILNHNWHRVITPGSSSFSSMKLHLESSSGYPLRIHGERKPTRVTISFLPL